MAKDKSFYVKSLICACILLVLFSLFMPASIEAFALENGYTSVIDDLSKDTEFAVYHYAEDKSDHSIEVINIAESINKELFIYVYNPSSFEQASSINISTGDTVDFSNYKLALIDKNGTLSKYKVEGFTTLTGPERKYNISTIFRPFDSTIDVQADNGNVTTEVAYKVAKEFVYSTVDNKEVLNVFGTEVITVTDKFVGYCQYSEGFFLHKSACNSHFVAFDTDKPIDKLLEADVFYTTQEYTRNYQLKNAEETFSFGAKNDNKVTLSYKDKVTHTGKHGATYTWDRIQSVDDFIKTEDTSQKVYSGAIVDKTVGTQLTAESIKKLRGNKWVLRFCETDINTYNYTDYFETKGTMVGDVSILRLKFDTCGQIYNLGVVDNKTTQPTPEGPSNNETVYYQISELAKKIISIILGVILGVLLLILIWPILPYIFKAIGFILLAPFKLIELLVSNIQNGKKKNKNKKK